MILIWITESIPGLEFYNIVYTFQYKTYIVDQAQMIVEPNRKDKAEQNSYKEIPNTEISMKILGYTNQDLTPFSFATPQY